MFALMGASLYILGIYIVGVLLVNWFNPTSRGGQHCICHQYCTRDNYFITLVCTMSPIVTLGFIDKLLVDVKGLKLYKSA